MGFGFYHISYNNKTNKFTLSDASDNSGTIANFPGGDETEIYTGTTALDILGISSSDLTTQAANDINFFFFPYISTTTPVFTPFNTIFNSKQDNLTAGTGIDITNNIISASNSGTNFQAGTGLTLDTSTDPDTLNVDSTQSISTINNASNIVNTAGSDITITCNSGGAFSQNFNYKFESSNGDLDIPGDYLKNGTNILASKQDTLTFNSPSSNNTNPSTSAQIKAYAQKAFFASNPEADLGTEFFLDINTGLIGILKSNHDSEPSSECRQHLVGEQHAPSPQCYT